MDVNVMVASRLDSGSVQLKVIAVGSALKWGERLTRADAAQLCAASAFDTICSSEPRPATASTITAKRPQVPKK